MHLKSFAAFLGLAGLSLALGHRNERRQTSSTKPYVYTGPKVPGYNFSMPVDHFNTSDTRTYSNRYWVNDTYYKPGGPVFLYDGGEEGLTEQAVAEFLAEYQTTSSVMRLAAKYNGVAIAWEHRYYGLSLPVPFDKTTHEPRSGISGYRYLNVEQALEDVVYFAKNWKPSGCSGDACTARLPSETPWIWVGGSYPGIRGALIRIRNPEIFYAVWASSAPVEATYDGSIYFAPIQATLPGNCSSDVRAAVKYADEVMSGQHGVAAFQNLQRLVLVAERTASGLNQTYNLTRANQMQPDDIGGYMVTALTEGNFQYFGPSDSTHIFCNYLETYNPSGRSSFTNNTAITVLSNLGGGKITSEGVAATYGAPTALNAYFYALRKFQYEQYLTEQQGGTSTTQPPPDHQADILSWSYQTLTEFGWFSGSNPANITAVSRYYNLTVVREQEIAQYVDADNEDFPAYPNVTAFNKYGGWNMRPSNVMFTDGQFDPYIGGTPMSNMTWNDAPIRDVVQVVPQCNVPPTGSDVFGLVYPGQVHVPDLTLSADVPYNQSTPIYQGVQLFSSALDTWLPCFKPS